MRKLWILCAFLSVFFSASIHAQDKVRFLTYNLQEGLHHFEREDTFVNWAKEKKPDIAFLQELNTYSPKRLSEMAARYGHPHSTIVIADFFHIGITSRWPITDIRAVTNPLTHGMIIAKSHGYTLVAVHLHPRHQDKRVEEIAYILNQISRLPKGSKVVMAGDFNSWNRYDGAHFTEPQIEFLRKRAREDSRVHNLVNNLPDFTIIDTIEKAGLVDAYRYEREHEKSGDEKHRFVARRGDYFWLSPNLVPSLRYCNLIYDDVTAHLSDHHPVILELAAEGEK